jgi:hypothetical protein
MRTTFAKILWTFPWSAANSKLKLAGDRGAYGFAEGEGSDILEFRSPQMRAI